MEAQINALLSRCRELAFDLNFSEAKAWKKAKAGRFLVGHLPIYFPREIVHAAGGLPVGIMGGGDIKQIIKGDAFYQSYICHMPRGVIEMALDDNFDEFDGFIFPSICDVIRNLSGIFKLLGKGRFVKYLDYPQNFTEEVGGTFYRRELQHVMDEMAAITGKTVTTVALNHSIELYNTNRRMLAEIYDIRQHFPWRLSYEQLYCLMRAGLVIPVEEHNEMLSQVLDYISNDVGEAMDNIRVVISGAFCEQPPLGLIRSIEIAGCYVVDDDLILGSRWIQGDIQSDTDDPIGAIVSAYLERSTFSSSVYDVDNPKEARLIELAQRRKADGILFAAPSFCDPALLDQPQLQKACDDAGIRYISFKFSENTGQFKVIKEQVGAFSDSIKLWEEPAL
ncbi:MAG: benzoyl-CoA reductase subunit C [Gammaproteobacteria bacterium]|nr:MAG: benzoyl-CoA reductase subunit C [Gammaproteobacteria bacterium]